MASRLNFPISVRVLPAKTASKTSFNIGVSVTPASVPTQTVDINYPFTFDIRPIDVNLSDPIKNTAFQFLSDILENFIDEDRELKTLLNFGEDTQNVVLAYRRGPVDQFGINTLQLKLLNPIDDGVSLNTPAFISTEVANTVIQKSKIRFAPPIDNSEYLRPRNTGIKLNDQVGKTLKNITLNVLELETGSLGKFDDNNNVTFEDNIFRRWYSYDFNSAELNIDFSDYNNFVFYGSATMRLQAFRQKLLEIEKLTKDSLQFEGGVFTGSLAAAGASYVLQQSAKLSKEKEDIIRSFDRYEQYLYFTPSGSDSPYSASFEYAEDGVEFNEIGYWPKTSTGTLFPVNSEEATIWFDTQIQIAQRFDEVNENNLINTIPTHIREDEENASYFTFVVMIGHFFDLIKPYIDQFPQIYSRYIDPDQELSKDLVSEIADSVGFTMPTIDSVFSLAETVLGTEDRRPRRDFAVESYKRLLHNLPFFAKTKGTRTSLRSVLRTLGITEELIDIKESGTADTGSSYVFSEFYNAIKFDGQEGEYITLPLSSSLRTPYPRSIQLNISVAENRNMTILNGDDSWTLDITEHPSNPKLIRVELNSNNTILSSSYFDNNSSDLINISLRTYTDTQSSTLRVAKVYQEDILFDSIVSESLMQNEFLPLWNSTENLYIGGSGSIITNNFAGNIDEVRLWGINLSDTTTLNTAFDPGSNAGDIFTDASDNLYIQISLNKIDSDLLVNSGSIINESPYKDISDTPSLEEIEVSGITSDSFVRNSRFIKQILPRVGASAYVTNKVKVIPPAIFKGQFITPQGVKKLSRTESIVSILDKPNQRGRNKVNVSASPTNIINQNIIRNIGLENVNQSYGIPNDTYKTLPNTFQDLQDHYNKFYYVNVDKNRFVRTIASVSSVISQIIDYFIPSRATALVGVTIEPNILERTKLPPIRKIKLYGIGSRRTNNVLSDSSQFRKDYEATFTLSDEVNVSEELVSGSYLTKDAILDADQTIIPIVSSSALDAKTANSISTVSALTARFDNIYENISGSLSKFNATLDDIEKSISGSFHLIDKQHLEWYVPVVLNSIKNDPSVDNPDYDLLTRAPGRFVQKKVSINLGYDELNKVGFSLGTGPRFGLVGIGKEGAEPYGRIYSRKLFEYEITRPRSGGITSLTRSALYAISPSCDLDNFGSRNFFIQDFGVYYFPKKIRRPVYVNPLNAVWNLESQVFTGSTEWSYGQKYNVNDVVFQNIQRGTSDSEILGEELTDAARFGNGRFYVFKTQPSYENSVEVDERSPAYLGSVPSTLPPSLDKDNWARVRFSPKIVPEPKRVVFDTFIIPDPTLNDFKTTTIDISRRIDLPERFIDLFTVGSIGGNSRRLGQIRVQNISSLFAVQMNSPTTGQPNIRLRLYRSAEARDLDITRPQFEYPTPDAGVILDMNIDRFNSLIVTNPIPTLVSQGFALDGNIFYTIDNLNSSTADQINLYLYYFAIQIEPRLPFGYLRKHYRYFRDNSTATKRRNFLGCKNTEDTTIDGLPPVQIFLSEDTDATVDPTLENTKLDLVVVAH
jgi:hypothetical protein